MKKSGLLAIICLYCSFSFAQSQLVAQHSDKGMFLNHTVTAKENFYSIGRMYNISAKDIAAFNGLEMEKGLTIGQTVHVPLNGSNFTQEENNGKPVYYVVGQKEGLYRVSVNNNKVLMANLRKWNNLANDNISPGQKLIVGYLVSPETKNSTANNTATINPPIENKEPEKQKTETVEKKQPVTLEEKPVEKQDPIKTVSDPGHTTSNDAGGYFKSEFLLQTKSQPVSKDHQANAGIFKTASGWQDAKYYALIDNVEPGTIIRIINPNNNKSIYAKVLDKMTGIRQNQGYELRISNAAATALDITDTEKFSVRVNY